MPQIFSPNCTFAIVDSVGVWGIKSNTTCTPHKMNYSKYTHTNMNAIQFQDKGFLCTIYTNFCELAEYSNNFTRTCSNALKQLKKDLQGLMRIQIFIHLGKKKVKFCA